MTESMNVLVEELRALGVPAHFRAGAGKVGTTIKMEGRSEWTPEFSRQVNEVLARHGLRELREGLWGRGNTGEDAIRQWEELARADDEYKDIHRTITEHADWSDQEVAKACGVEAEYVAELRYEWDR